MKQLILLLFLGFVMISSLSAQQDYKIDTEKSVLVWKGFYLFHFGGHEGTVKIKSGTVVKTNNRITAGHFVIDMNSIVNTDGGYNEGLVSHLKDADFFDVKKYPESTLKIKKVDYGAEGGPRVYADLTIKGITEEIEFILEEDPKSKAKISARFKIDRQLWNINFNYLKNNAISDAMEFNVRLVLK